LAASSSAIVGIRTTFAHAVGALGTLAGTVRHVARIPLVAPNGEDTPDEARAAFDSLGGVHPNVYRAMANHPQALQAFSDFGKVVYFDNAISPAQRELAYLTASVTNNCHY
jgi:alkylhydroperoxidase family enzyme